MRVRGAIARVLTAGLLCLGAFGITAGSIRQLLPMGDSTLLRARLEGFIEAKDDYDAIYLGSSHILHSFVPEVIDPILSSSGRPFRSFNLATDGMFSFETNTLLREVLALRPARLRLAIIEVPTWRPAAGMNLKLERYADWHDWRSTCLVLQSMMLQDLPWRDRLKLARAHLGLAARRLGNYGQGPRLWRGIFPESILEHEKHNARSRGGYEALEDSDEAIVQLRQRNFILDQASYRQKLERARRETSHDREISLDRYNLAALEWQQDILSTAGVQSLYVIPPVLRASRFAAALHTEGYLPHLIEIRDPSEFAELYTLDNRFDEGHLNRRGAERHSELFAHRLKSKRDELGL